MRLIALLSALVFVSGAAAQELTEHLNTRLGVFHDPESPYVMIEAHRGSFSNMRPENSLPAIEHAIVIGADVIELDVALTSDQVLILMHDKTLDRTTTLAGPVGEVSSAAIRGAYLKHQNGAVSNLRIPTLEEALELMRGRVFFRLDLKCGRACADQVYDLVESKDLMRQAVIGEWLRPRFIAAGLSDDDLFIVGEKIEDYGAPTDVPPHVDCIQIKDFDGDAPPLEAMIAFAPSVRMVAYPYSDRRSGGRGDIRSRTQPDEGWGWLVDAGADILLTDTPVPLIAYLEARGLR